MRPFSYTSVRSVSDAIAAHSRAGGNARYIAGGTTLYDLMKLGIETPAHVIDIRGIAHLARIDDSGDELQIGALAAMSTVASHKGLLENYPVLVESLSKAASQQLRNMATVGGNLFQRTRCMYFRNGTGNPASVGHYPCNRRAPGSGCAAIGGLDRGQAVHGQSASCTAVSPGDWPVALTALDARVELCGPEGKRDVPVADLYRAPGETPHLEFDLAPGELVTTIRVPKTPAGRLSTYLKIRDRQSYAFALASAAVALEMDGGRVKAAHIALGGVATTPWRAHAAERALAGQALSADLALAAGRAAMAGAQAGRHNAFKIDLCARTIADAVMIAAARS